MNSLKRLFSFSDVSIEPRIRAMPFSHLITIMSEMTNTLPLPVAHGGGKSHRGFLFEIQSFDLGWHEADSEVCVVNASSRLWLEPFVVFRSSGIFWDSLASIGVKPFEVVPWVFRLHIGGFDPLRQPLEIL